MMSRPSERRRREAAKAFRPTMRMSSFKTAPRRILVTTVLALGVIGIFALGVSEAAVSCVYNPATRIATIDSNGPDTFTLSRTAGGVILVNGSPCFDVSGASIAVIGNTDIIDVNGNANEQTFILDIGSGIFAEPPEAGKVPPDADFDEALITADLGGGTDTLEIHGSDGGDDVIFGETGIAFTEDESDDDAADMGNPGSEDADMTVANIDNFFVFGKAGNDSLTGQGGQGTGDPFDLDLNLAGGAGNDSESGGDGDDVFDQDAAPNGRDTMRGFFGNDTVDYSKRSTAVLVTAGDNQPNDGEDNPAQSQNASPEADNVGGQPTSPTPVPPSSNLYDDIENIKGGLGNDRLSGSASANFTGSPPSQTGANLIEGGPGNDTINGLGGPDTELGGEGNDTFNQGASPNGADLLIGGPGTDTASYSSRSPDVPDLTGTQLQVAVTAGDNTANDGDVAAAEGDNVGGATSDIENLSAGSPNDLLSGTADANTLNGGAGNDTLLGLGGDDTLNGGDGNDFMNGHSENDTLVGGAGDDTEFGETGDDVFSEGSTENGSDAMSGGGGTDTVNYFAISVVGGNPVTVGRPAAVTVTLGDGVANDGESGEGDNAGTVAGDIENATGGANNDNLTGSSFNNVLNGGTAGNDTLTAGAGNDTLVGGAGNDTENGEDGDDTFVQDAAANGADTLRGGNNVDTVDYSARANAVIVTLADNVANDGDGCAQAPTCEGDNAGAVAGGDIENIKGGNGGDTLNGSPVVNNLQGGGGADKLFGLAEDDTLIGGAGDDFLVGGADDDSEDGGEGNDTLNQESAANGADTLVGGPGFDTADYSARSNPVNITKDGLANDGESGENDDVDGTIENALAGPTIQVLPEGATHSGFTTFVLLSNPTGGAGTVDLTFLTPSGPVSPAAAQNLSVDAGSRRSISVNAVLGSEADVATKVTAVGAPIVAELSVHKSGSLANLDMAATKGPDSTWVLPEGATHSGFSTFVTIANPNEVTGTTVDVDYLTKGGGVVDGPDSLSVPAGGRVTLNVNAPTASNGCGCSDDVSTVVNVVGINPPVVAGVSLHREAGGDLAIGGSMGETDPQDTHVVAEGATHSGWHTFVSVANPGSSPVTASVTFLTKASGVKSGPVINVGANSRETIDVNVACACADDVSTAISANGPVAVESSIQKLDGSGFVIADSISAAGPDLASLTGTQWLAAEGATHSGFGTFILIANPDTSNDAVVKVRFLTATGSVDGPPALTIPKGSRVTLAVDDFLPSADASTLVEATTGSVVVEMSIDRISGGFSKGRSLAFRLA